MLGNALFAFCRVTPNGLPCLFPLPLLLWRFIVLVSIVVFANLLNKEGLLNLEESFSSYI